MVRFLTTAGTAAEIQRLVRGAREEITLVSPYLQLSRDLAERLFAAEERGVQVRLVYGKDRSIQKDTRERLARLAGLRLFYYEDLHAKCYYSEEKLVLTSMNLYEYSEKNNREMGIVATAEEEVYRDAREEVEDIAGQAEAAPLGDIAPGKSRGRGARDEKEGGSAGNGARGRKKSPSGEGGLMGAIRAAFGGEADGEEKAESKGYCIRCGESIDYDPERPYCLSCYRRWAKWENPEYEEDYCHRCGGESSEVRAKGALSMERPECLDCYRERRQKERA